MDLSPEWDEEYNRITAEIHAVVEPLLLDACFEVLARYKKATYVSIGEGMGRVWIEIDGVHYHADSDDEPNRFNVVGLKSRKTWHTIKGLRPLADAMVKAADFLDSFNASFPDVEARR